MEKTPSIIWFRDDLRLRDNHALLAAIGACGPVVPVFIWAPEEHGKWAPGSASLWWLNRSLASLDRSLAALGSRLVLRRGDSVENLLEIAAVTGARAVYRNRTYGPATRARDADVDRRLRESGIESHDFNAALLFEPWEISKRSGGPFQVFTPFWKACLGAPDPPPPAAAPRRRMISPSKWPKSLPLGRLGLAPSADRTSGKGDAWRPGEEGANVRLKSFAKGRLSGYTEERDRPDLSGTSRLSPHLRFGEIGPRQIWSVLERRCGDDHSRVEVARVNFTRQLIWREFAYHLLYHFPQTTEEPLRRQFIRLERKADDAGLAAWERGRTGYPIVDAGMRELWATGWMHNRARMIAASFLVKDLLLPWQAGAKWFWDTLVDADLANNTLGWQWVAGCGADAAPFFRIFNPVRQGMRFDPEGDYVRKWVPEIARLPARWIQRPWEAPGDVLSGAGIVLGRTYPRPMVDHEERRVVALAAYRKAVGAKRVVR